MVDSVPKVRHVNGVTGVAAQSLDATFGEMDGSGFEMPIPEGAFEPLMEDEAETVQRRSFAETKAVPLTLYADGNTATQVLLLLGMLRYCMENSREVLDTATGEAKEYAITVRVKNRTKADFMASVGDEPIPAIPMADGDCFVGS